MWDWIAFAVLLGVFAAVRVHASRHPRLTPVMMCVSCTREQMHYRKLCGDPPPEKEPLPVAQATLVLGGESLCSPHAGRALIDEIWPEVRQ
jgi:hypothetical protein